MIGADASSTPRLALAMILGLGQAIDEPSKCPKELLLAVDVEAVLFLLHDEPATPDSD